MTEQFHCVCCEKLISRQEAEILFKTGFYRRSYRLGYCRSCAMSRDAEDSGSGGSHIEIVALPAERITREGSGFIGRGKILTA